MADTDYSKPIEKKPAATGKVIVKKKSLSTKMSDAFIKEDIDVVAGNIVDNVIIPGIIDIIFDTFSRGLEMILYGDNSTSSGRATRRTTTGTNYNKISFQNSNRRTAIAAPKKSKAESREFIVADRDTANEIISTLKDTIEQYGWVPVSDLYQAIRDIDGNADIRSSHMDTKWGWDNLDDAAVRRVREGYLLVFPPTIPER